MLAQKKYWKVWDVQYYLGKKRDESDDSSLIILGIRGNRWDQKCKISYFKGENSNFCVGWIEKFSKI